MSNLARTMFLTVLLGAPALGCASGLEFSGNLIATPVCSVVPESELVEVDFKSVINQEIYANGRTRGRPIDLRVKNCELESANRSLKILFIGNESPNQSGLLVVESANNIGLVIGIESKDGTALPLNQAHDIETLISGSNMISFNSFLQADSETLAHRTLGLGVFHAAITFKLIYE